MGKRGPAKQPTKLRILNGNPGKRPLPTNEPQPRGALPRCPPGMSKAAAKYWRKWSKELSSCGIATGLDATALEMLCESYAEYLAALAQVQESGPVWVQKREDGLPKFAYSPYWAVMNQAWKKTKQMMAEFGMTPSSRVGMESTHSPSDDLDRLIG